MNQPSKAPRQRGEVKNEKKSRMELDQEARERKRLKSAVALLPVRAPRSSPAARKKIGGGSQRSAYWQ